MLKERKLVFSNKVWNHLPCWCGYPCLHMWGRWVSILPWTCLWFANQWTTLPPSLFLLHWTSDHLLSHSSSSYLQLPTDARNTAHVGLAERWGWKELKHCSRVPSCKTLNCPIQRGCEVCYKRLAVKSSPKPYQRPCIHPAWPNTAHMSGQGFPGLAASAPPALAATCQGLLCL